MSRQQFIAELTQYLTFVTPEEHDEIIQFFEEKFDNAGSEGEAMLLMELGTPMSIAIALKRRKEAGELSAAAPVSGAKAEESHSEQQVESPEKQHTESPAARAAESPVKAEPLERAEPQEAARIAMPEPLPVREAAPESPVAAKAAEIPPAPVREDILAPAAVQDEPLPEPPERVGDAFALDAIGATPPLPAPEIKEPEPRKKLSAGAAFGAVILSLLVIAVFIVPAGGGGYLLVLMMNFLFGGLMTLSTLKDALWMFCFGFALGAAGLLTLWFFVWAIISIIRRLFRGKPPKRSGFVRGMRKVWKTTATVCIFMLVLGIACGAVGFSMGGKPVDLFDNQTAMVIFDWISNNALAVFLSGIFS